MDFIRGQNTPYFSRDSDFKIWFRPVELPGLSRDGFQVILVEQRINSEV